MEFLIYFSNYPYKLVVIPFIATVLLNDCFNICGEKSMSPTFTYVFTRLNLGVCCKTPTELILKTTYFL